MIRIFTLLSLFTVSLSLASIRSVFKSVKAVSEDQAVHRDGGTPFKQKLEAVEINDRQHWQIIDTEGTPHPRHEAGFVECANKLYLLGGRGIKPVDIYDPETNAWSHGAEPPIELHHFQPVVWENEIWVVGAMTGPFPRETALPHIMIYSPRTDTWRRGPEIPEARRRGAAGAIIRGGRLFMVCGIRNGHWDGWVSWLDSYDFSTGQWQVLPDAPRARDHFQAVAIDGALYAVAGRRSSVSTRQSFELTIAEVDRYDFATQTWKTLPTGSNLPTPRAGNSAFAWGKDVLVAGGESGKQQAAHDEVEALDTVSGRWRALPPLARGRHGTGLAALDGVLYTCSGCGNRGGAPELDSLEKLSL